MSANGIASSLEPPGPLEHVKELHATAIKLGEAAAVSKENTEDNRREWRDMMFTAAAPFEKNISGIILFEETLMKHDATLKSKYTGQSFVDVLKARGIIPGIKVDKGAISMPCTDPEETTTQGLDDLLDRCKKYYERGARFSKWRCTYTVSPATPSALAIMDNAEVLARYAAISQQAGLVPLIEPEVLMTHDEPIERALNAHIAAYSALFERCCLHKVDFAGLMLKASMVVPGQDHSKSTPEQVAEATVHCLSKTVPALVPTTVFLSGGLSDADSIEYLNAINKRKNDNPKQAPWALTFSFGRALQGVAMKAWSDGNVDDSQNKWVDRARWSGEAAVGKYTGGCPA